MNHNNQQPGSAGLPELPDPYACLTKLQGGYEPVFTAEQYRQGQRDAIAASRRAAGGEVLYFRQFDMEHTDLKGPILCYRAPADEWVVPLRLAAPSLPDVAMPEQMRKALKDVTDVLDIFGDLGDGQIDPAAWRAAKAEEKIKAAREVLAAQPAEGSAQVAAEGATQAGEWISVDERLPEEMAHVAILYWPYNNRENAQIVGWAEYVEGTFYTHEGDEHHPPSHWMNLPEFPRIDGDKQGAQGGGWQCLIA